MAGGTLAGRTVLVTGGNRGIGLGIAEACAGAGAQVVIWGRDGDRNASALAALESGGAQAVAVECDVTDEADVARAMERSLDAAGGRIDTVIANAGMGGALTRFVDLDLAAWRQVTAINLDGAFLTLQAGARHMVERGDGGALVVVSSTSAFHGAARNQAYGAAKAGVLGLMRALAVELARHRVRVNALLPGWTVTEMTEGVRENDRFREATTARTPVGRWAEASEMGPAAVFLADPTVVYHTGDTVVVDGGYTVF